MSTSPNAARALDACASEPIHQLGRIQEFAGLLAASEDGVVQHVSSNLSEILSLSEPSEALIGQLLTEVLDPKLLEALRPALLDLDRVSRVFDVLDSEGRRYNLVAHLSGRHTVVEIEPVLRSPRFELLAHLSGGLDPLRSGDTLAVLSTRVARAVRRLGGFDSVLVYRFFPDASGEVVAEDRVPDYPSYFGLRFPASDIPEQARRLYLRNRIRLIADVRAPGAVVLPAVSPEGAPLDLSLSGARSVSPIHLRYLENMGVRASMSLSLVVNEKLWGLVACHHRSPRFLSAPKRALLELYSEVASGALSRLEDSVAVRALEDTAQLQLRLSTRLSEGEALIPVLADEASELSALIPNDGLVIYADERFHCIGITPEGPELPELARFLNTAAASSIFSTHALSAIHPPASAYTDRVAGVLAVPISRSPRDYLIFCRREAASTVTWAGVPSKQTEFVDGRERLMPRESFAAWKEEVRGTCIEWSPHAKAAAERLRVNLLEVLLRVVDAARVEHERTRERLEIVNAELNHRVRNVLNLIRGVVSRTIGNDPGSSDFFATLDGRIQALARAHDELTRESFSPASLSELFRIESRAYAEARSDRVEIVGRDVLLGTSAYTSLALVAHELVTNSVKYGALSSGTGRVTVSTRLEQDGVHLEWLERGGPKVSPPTRRGFGTSIIERSVPYELRGDAQIVYEPAGVEARFRIPLEHVEVPSDSPAPAVLEAGSSEDEGRVSGDVLVVEDSFLIAMDAADLLSELGARRVETAASVKEALSHLESQTFDLAMLDVNLGSEQSLPVAEVLASRGIPFIVASGYGESPDLKQSYPPCVFVRKPFSSDSLKSALAHLSSMRDS